MDVSQVRARWLPPLFKLLGFDPVYLRGDKIGGRYRVCRTLMGGMGEIYLCQLLPTPVETLC